MSTVPGNTGAGGTVPGNTVPDNTGAGGEVTVRAGWALWGKQPGTRQDYSVVACSAEPFSRAEFAAIITRFAVGSPDVTATGPGALPWVTASWVGVDDDPHLGISITSHTGQVDGVGRPITQTAYFCVPYAQLSETPVSYCDLHDALVRQAASLRPADGPMLQFTVPAFAADQVADTVRRVGEQTAIATAALLLTGPVTVAQADGTSLRDRLEFIDAVASLLPYGYRVRFSGATWSDTGTKHRVRLAFAARPREDAAAVQWQRTLNVRAAGQVAFAYGERLRKLALDPARSAEAVGLPTVIAHLAADSRPRTFDRPQGAFDCLDRLDQPFRLLRAVRERRGIDVAELRQFIGSGRATALPDEADRVDLLVALAENGQAQDWPVLRSGVAGRRSPDDRVRILTAFGRRTLWATVPPDGGRAVDCLRLAADVGFEDAVLTGFLAPPGNAAGSPAGLQAVGGLLADTVLAQHPSGREFPAAAGFLSANLGLAAEYVAAASRTGRASSLLRWLDPQGTSRFARSFRVALSLDEGEISDGDLAQLGSDGPGGVRALLQVAAEAKSLGTVLPGFTRWLAGRSKWDVDEGRYWASHLSGFTLRDPVAQAWLDTALLIVTGMPGALPPGAETAAIPYADALAGIWVGLSRGAYPQFSGERCARGMASYLGGQAWTATSGQAFAVTEVAKRLHDFDARQVLATAVASDLAATPAARQWEFAREWLAWAAANEPGAVRERLLHSLATAPPGSDPADLAELCVQAYRAGIDPDSALRELATSGAVTSATQAYAVLTGVEHGFAAAGADQDAQYTWAFRLTELLAWGEFGAELGQELRALVSDWTRENIWLELRRLAIFAEAGRDRPYEWTEGERDDLAAIAAEIESMLKRSRKFQLPKLRVSLRGGTPDAGDLGPGQLPGEAVTTSADGPGREDTVPVPPRPE